MEIRNATMDDLQAIAAVEAACFSGSGGCHGRGICRTAGTLCRSFLAAA